MKRLMMEKQKECHQMLLAKDTEMKKLMRLMKEQKKECIQILIAKDADTKKLMNAKDKTRKRILLLKKTKTTKLIMAKDTEIKKCKKECKRILLVKDTEITKLRTSKGKEIEKLNIIVSNMKEKVVSLQDNVQYLKEDMECVHFDNQLKQREMRKDFNSVLGSKQNTIKKMNETMIDQREMTCKMLDEVNDAKQKARVMTKKAEHVTNVSTAHPEKDYFCSPSY